MKKTPFISVIMPVFNAGEYLVEAIESILNQTYQNFEFIIVDDCSTDTSWKIICHYQKRYSSLIRSIRLRKNRNHGGDACANVGFAMANGSFIARMDADDIAHPERLAKQVGYMQKHSRVIVLGTQADVIDQSGKVVGEKREPTSNNAIRHDYFMYHPMIHPSVMIRRSLLPKRSCLYPIKYSANNDLLAFFELLQYGQFANLPDKLLQYRIHGHNDSLVNPKGRFFNTLRIRLFAWGHLGYQPTIRALFTTTLQSFIILCMPSKIIMKLYMFWRGITVAPALVSER